MFGAVTITYEEIIQQLRIIAETWFQDKADSLQMIEIINDFKQLVAARASMWRIWQLILHIEPKEYGIVVNFLRENISFIRI